MRCSSCFLSAGRLALLASFVTTAALPAEVYVTHTNWVDEPITNVVEVRMPKNIFIVQYRTNWVPEFRTNLISVYQTNRSQVFLTNQVLVQLVRTNFVTAYRTNFETRNVTNWETAQVLKTNLIRRPATNLVTKIDSQRSSSAVASPTTTAPVVQSVAPSADGWVVETTGPSTKIGGAQWEVRLRVRSTKDATNPLVRRWRIEHLDAGILNFKQGQILTLELAPGRYQIEASVQRKTTTPVQLLRALLTVTPEGTSLQPSSGKDLAVSN